MIDIGVWCEGLCNIYAPLAESVQLVLNEFFRCLRALSLGKDGRKGGGQGFNFFGIGLPLLQLVHLSLSIASFCLLEHGSGTICITLNYNRLVF